MSIILTMDRQEAIKKAVLESGVQQNVLSQKIGVSETQISLWMSDEHKFKIRLPNFEAVMNLLNYKVIWNDISKTDCTIVAPGEELPPSEEYPQGATWEPPDLNKKPIPVVSTVSAGKSDYFSDEGHLIYDTGDVVQRPYDMKDIHAYGLRIDKVFSDSMQPLIKAGDIMIVSPFATVVSNDLVAVRTKQHSVMIKIVQFHRNFVELLSTNPAHAKIKVDQDDIRYIHKIVHIKKK